MWPVEGMNGLFYVRGRCTHTCTHTHGKDSTHTHLCILCLTWATLNDNVRLEIIVCFMCVRDVHTHTHTQPMIKPHTPLSCVWPEPHWVITCQRKWMGTVHSLTHSQLKPQRTCLFCVSPVSLTCQVGVICVRGFCPHFHISNLATSIHAQYTRRLSFYSLLQYYLFYFSLSRWLSHQWE